MYGTPSRPSALALRVGGSGVGGRGNWRLRVPIGDDGTSAASRDCDGRALSPRLPMPPGLLGSGSTGGDAFANGSSPGRTDSVSSPDVGPGESEG